MATETTTKNLEDLIRKIEALLAQADHPNTGPAEAEVFRNKAEQMMYKYRIDEMALGLGGQATTEQEEPEWAEFYICDVDNEFNDYYYTIFLRIISHLDIKCEIERGYDESGRPVYNANVIGYSSDRRFAQILWQSVRLSFGKNLEPVVDPNLSDAENCYNLRNAGMEGKKIAAAVFGDISKSMRIKARNMARKHAEEIGEDHSSFSGRGNSMEVYRESYAQAFLSTITGRLQAMAHARVIEAAGTMVLASRSNAVNEALYERYPYRKPRQEVATASESTFSSQGQCGKCRQAKSGYCREHGWMRPRTARTRKANQGAYDRGASAARNVNLGITGREVK